MPNAKKPLPLETMDFKYMKVKEIKPKVFESKNLPLLERQCSAEEGPNSKPSDPAMISWRNLNISWVQAYASA